MSANNTDEPATYEVRLTEPAEAEADAAYMQQMRSGMEGAQQWYAGLLRALSSLSLFPGRCPFAPESEALGGGIRQLLYGKGRRAYRILYRVIEPAEEHPGIVRILHIRHALQKPLDLLDE